MIESVEDMVLKRHGFGDKNNIGETILDFALSVLDWSILSVRSKKSTQ